ncbi:uncharacterized protein LOC142584897 isoform X1 [Dermacentor variabilis]|uniref:uncharacterized protein LOC142584897 isoform X1 n=1 Tax=Dermacentor variabilis TaxID=34621 RepID=UPI003F5C1680
MPSQMVDAVRVKPKRTVVVSEATRGSRRLALHRLRASLIGENGRLPQANSDAARSLQWGTEDSRSQGGEEPAKKGRAGGKNGKTETNSSGMPRNHVHKDQQHRSDHQRLWKRETFLKGRDENKLSRWVVKSQSKCICETGQLGSEQQAGPAETGA